MKQGMDIIGPLSQALGQVNFVLILPDYFTSWVEVGAFAKVREKKVKYFIWKNIISRFGVPKEIVCENWPKYVGDKVTVFLDGWKLRG